METIDTVKKIIDKNGALVDDFDRYSKCYLLTTENIKDYLSLFDINDKSVLTVCGSGDQTLSVLSEGAKSVKTFDVNKLTKNLLELKKGLILGLEIDEYLEFFNKEGKYFLDKGIYLKIRDLLESETRCLYDYIFYNFDKKNIFNKFFFGYLKDVYKMSRFISYFDEIKYYVLKEKLTGYNIEFINSDIFNLTNCLCDSYDLILFSNITDYICEGKEKLIRYREYIESLKKYLNQDGVIQIGYIYDSFHSGRNGVGTYFSFKKNRDIAFTSDKDNIFFTNTLIGYNDYSIDSTLSLCKK